MYIYIYIYTYTYNITTCINYLLQHVPGFLRIKHLDLSRSLIKIWILMFKWAIKLDYTMFMSELRVKSWWFIPNFSAVFHQLLFLLSQKKQMENMENTSSVASHVFSPNSPSWDLRYIPMVGWLIAFPAWPSNRSMIEDVKWCKYQTGSNLICSKRMFCHIYRYLHLSSTYGRSPVIYGEYMDRTGYKPLTIRTILIGMA